MIITVPKGIVPRYNPRVIQDNQAQVAENCVLESGDCRPLKSPSLVQGLDALTLTVFPSNGTWKQWSSRADVVASPVVSPDNRLYYTAGSGGKKTDDTTGELSLGVSKPDAGPTLTINGTGDGQVDRSSVYIYTRVTEWGEESSPSKPSGLMDVEFGQHVEFSAMSDGGDSHISHYRLYRAVGGASSNVWLLVPYQTTAGVFKYDGDNNIIYDIPKHNIGSAKDGMRDDDLNISLDTQGWHEPPADLHSLTDFSNGLIGGLSGKEVCFSHPWHPFAWPTAYRYQLDADGVGMGSMNGVPIVFTSQSVYLFEGSSPDSFHQRKISDVFGCESKMSIASMPHGVFFASKDGLCMAGNDGVQLLTKGVWTREQWSDLSPESLMGFYHNESYYGFFIQNLGVSKGFILPFEGESVTTFELDGNVLGGYLEPSVGLYLIIHTSSGRGLYEFDEGDVLEYTWKSKVFRRPFKNFGAMKIIGEQGNSNISFLVDGVEKYSGEVDHNKGVRLPSGFRGQEFEVEISGNKRWSTLAITGSMGELSGV